ncbi:hypothetical protein [Acinetobacter boissieri]|uniref:Four helix bundle sensory module for signal transduction n=1 Tax=Acinetobacter boissieri TaxID=1219383 RepID=A0A1G6GYW5_9GAMM|nr:hypothetical protein [Acinetobacter boissieri]SDB87094.1 hypothetical protein SAMN05421733_10338 [Acinetobacter boissieri]
MTFSLPTDRFDKFLTIGGMFLLFWAVNISVTNYEKAEHARIKAMVIAQDVQYKYKDYSNAVNRGAEIYNNAIKNKEDPKKYKTEINKSLKDVEKYDPIIRQATLDMLEASNNLVLFERIRNFWLFITIIVFAVGIISTIIGLISWYKSHTAELK